MPSKGASDDKKDKEPLPSLRLTDYDLQVVEELLTEKIQNYRDYVSDPMMKGQSYMGTAKAEIDRLTPVLEHVQAERLAR